jgi:hypothetical protein
MNATTSAYRNDQSIHPNSNVISLIAYRRAHFPEGDGPGPEPGACGARPVRLDARVEAIASKADFGTLCSWRRISRAAATA